MKFFKKFLILGLFALFGVSFCSAGAILYGEMRADETRTNTSYVSWDLGDGGCFWKHVAGGTLYWKVGGTEYNTTHGAWVYCGTGTVEVKTSSSSYGYKVFTGIKLVGPQGCPSCPSCPSQFTSLECQTEYNLIPISEVTENYCTFNFDLISPSDCPLSEGTGDTQWSALRLNNVQYAGASNIFINVSDLLDYSTTYTDSGSSFVLDVDGYVADTGYLNDILTVQEYHPNSEDFTMSFVGALTLGLPYVMVALFVVFVRKLIKKIFKS